MEDFKNLKVWVKAYELTLSVYGATSCFPKEEMYGITSHVRRSATSIEANIAEGCGRRSYGELRRFLQIARGSASELECHLLIARDLHLLSEEGFERLQIRILEVQRMLCSLAERVSVCAAKLVASG